MHTLGDSTMCWWGFLLGCGLFGTTNLQAAEGQPNIVVILSDDMGFSDLGCYGGELRTPHLDALAANGLRFTQFYNTARCCPTRASLLTGLYPHQAGIGHMTDAHGPEFPGYQGDLNDHCRTIAEVLKPAGYRNYAVGKWHVTKHLKQDGPQHNWPRQRGFDRFYGMVSGGGSFYDPWTLARDNRLISPYADPEYQPQTYYFTDALTDHAVKFVGEHVKDHASQPFFLYLTYTAAHWPMHALPEDIARHRGRYDAGYEPIRKARFEKAVKLGLIDGAQPYVANPENWDDVKDHARDAACMEVYAAMVDRMDQGIGRLVEELRRTNQLDNTLILFLQDNGGCAELMGRGAVKNRQSGPRLAQPSLPPLAPETLPSALVPAQTRDGYPVRQGPGVMPGPADTYVGYGRGWATVSNTPFREYKHWVHEGGISTPLIAHWPRGIMAKGELRKQPGHLIDVMATCVEVAGATYPAEATPLPGRSLTTAFRNEPIARDAIFWEHEGNRAIRMGDWKAVAKGPGSPWELYDLSRDRIESRNLAQEEPARIRTLVTKWESLAKEQHVLPWIWKPAYQPLATE